MKYFKTTLAVLLASIILYGCASQATAPAPPAPSAEVIQITTNSETTYEDYPAAIEGAVNVEIRPQVDGFLQKVFVDEGSFVQKGQPLFKIDDQPFVQLVNSAKASL